MTTPSNGVYDAAPPFTTRNLSIAAFLRSRGFPVWVADHADPHLVTFASPVSPELLDAIAGYERGEAAVEPASYATARKSLHHEIDARLASRGGAR